MNGNFILMWMHSHFSSISDNKRWREPIQAEVCGLRKKTRGPIRVVLFFFPWITSSLAMRTTSPDTMEAFQRAAISFLSPPEPNLALVVKACFSGVPSGISPAASAPLLSWRSRRRRRLPLEFLKLKKGKNVKGMTVHTWKAGKET